MEEVTNKQLGNGLFSFFFLRGFEVLVSTYSMILQTCLYIFCLHA